MDNLWITHYIWYILYLVASLNNPPHLVITIYSGCSCNDYTEYNDYTNPDDYHNQKDKINAFIEKKNLDTAVCLCYDMVG